MPLFRKNDKAGKAPHTWYPDILHWREGDTIHCWNIYKAIGYIKADGRDLVRFTGAETSAFGYPSARFKYRSVSSDGKIFVEYNDHLHEFEFWRFIKVAENESLASRKLEERVQETDQYMQLMKHFQEAFDELQTKDETKLLKD